jgi:fucose permease
VLRDLTLGIGAVAAILWLTFFATPGSVEVATLIAAVGTGIWFASVSAHRLVDHRNRPNPMVFGLTALAAMLVLAAAAVISTATLFLVVFITVVGGTVGLIRAIRFGLQLGDDVR